ncbi:MAG TPA: cupredoxin domain-containing protein [Vicinamibacterales bacterium]|nr:cupredoxin domain-containing protein [Vicinamibacterales bacterium]
MTGCQPSMPDAIRSTARAQWFAAAASLLAAAAFAVHPGRADSGTDEKRQPVTHKVIMEGTSFEPPTLTITLGDSVEWVNQDFFPHTATAEGLFDSSYVPAGQSWTYKPDKQGEIKYVCTLHPTMKGTLIVK